MAAELIFHLFYEVYDIIVNLLMEAKSSWCFYHPQHFGWCSSTLESFSTTTHTLSWKKPSLNWLKCNVDCAIFRVAVFFPKTIQSFYSFGDRM